MKRVLWLSGTGATVLLVVGGVLLLMVNLYVQSPPMQARIREALSGNLKIPTEIRKTTYTPWDGLRIDGIAAPAGKADPASADPVRVRLSADSFRARLGLWSSLVERRLVVREILFDRPTLAWEQTPEGRWRWPGAKDKPEATLPTEAPEEPPGESAPATSAPPPPATAGREQTDRGAGAARKVAVAIEHFKLRHGALAFLNRRGEALGRFEDVNVNAQLEAADRGRGQLWFSRSALGAGERGWMTLNRFESPFTFSPDLLQLTGGRGEVAGGHLDLKGTLHPAEDGSPAEARCTLDDLSLEQLLKNAGIRHDLATGQVRGDFQWNGPTADAATGTGRGELHVTGGELRGLPLLATVGDALGIPELGHLRFQDARAECQLQGTTLHIDPLALVSTNLRLDAHGDAQLERPANDPTGLDLQARLTVGRAITRQLPQWIETSFIPVPDAADGARYVDFHVNGPLNNPRTDLVDRAVSRPLRTMLDTVFGNGEKKAAAADKKKDKDKSSPKKPAAAEPPAARPAATPPPGAAPAAPR